jgi:hypothetical protein
MEVPKTHPSGYPKAHVPKTDPSDYPNAQVPETRFSDYPKDPVASLEDPLLAKATVSESGFFCSFKGSFRGTS